MLNPNESISEKIVHKGFWIYVFVILTGPISYGIRMILSGHLSLSDFGLFYGIVSFVSLLAVYNDFGMTESLNYFVPKYIVKEDYGRPKALFLLALVFQVLTSLIVSVGLFFSAPWLAENYFHNAHALVPLRSMCLFFIGLNLMQISTSLLTIAQDTKYGKGVEFFRMLMTLLGVWLIAFLGFGTLVDFTWVWIGALFFGAFAAGIVSFLKYYRVYFAKSPLVFDRPLVGSFMKYSFATLLSANISVVLSQIDMQLIIYFLGADQVSPGYYSNYLSLIGIPFLVFSPILGFLFPVISELSGRQNYESIRVIWRSFAKYLGISAIWIGLFFLFFGTEFSVMFFGEKFAESGEILKYSALFIFFNFLIQLNFQVLAGVGRVRERAKILLITLVINILLNLFLILVVRMGARGSALAVGLSWIPLWYMSHRAIHEYTAKIDWKKLFQNTGFALATMLLLYLSAHAFSFSENPQLNSFFIILIAIFGSLIIFSAMNRDLLIEARGLFQSVRRKKEG